jgi:DNA-binding beta-propeller fold protein YncE
MIKRLEKASLLLMLVLLCSFTHLAPSAIVQINVTSTPINVIVTGASNIRSLAFDSATNTLYAGDWNSGNIYPINTVDNSIGTAIITGASGIGALAFDNATNTLYAGDFYSDNIYPINTVDNSIGTAFTTGAGQIFALSVNPATNTLYVGGASEEVIPINTIDDITGSVIFTDTSPIFALSFDSATSTLYAGDWGSGNIHPINTIDNSIGTAISTGAPGIGALSVNPATSTLYVGAWGAGAIYSINTIYDSIGTVIKTDAASSGIGALYVNATTNTLYVGDFGSGAVYMVSLVSSIPSVAVPNGVLHYVPAYLVSTSTYTMDANTQAMFRFDAGAYQSVEASNMQNFVAFNGVSGSPYDCWLVGNVLNEQQTDDLYTSNILAVWCDIPESGWLVDNNIYFGFYSPSTNNFNSVGPWGEAPTLSGNYAQYDNGALVFPALYQNFAGTSTPSGWTASGSGVTQNNGVTLTSGNILTANSFGLERTQLLEMDVNVPTATYGNLEAFGYIGQNGINGDAIDYADETASNTFVVCETGCIISGYPPGNVPTTYTQGYPSPYLFYLPANYVLVNAQNLESPNVMAYFEYLYGSSGTVSPIGMSAAGTGNPGLFLQWARIITFQPDGDMPDDTYGPLITPSVAITAGPSIPTVSVGQPESFTATVRGDDNGPFTYNWLVVNANTHAIVGDYLLTSSVPTDTFTFQPTNADFYNSPEYVNVIVTDAAQNTYTSARSRTYAIVPNIPITTITMSSGATGSLYLAGNTLYRGDEFSGNIFTINTLDNIEGPVIPTNAEEIYALSFDPASGTLYAGDYGSGNVIPINILNNIAGNAITTGAGSVYALAFDPATSTLYAGGVGGNVFTINTLNNHPAANSISTSAGIIIGLSFDPATSTLYAGDVNTGNVIPINTLDNRAGNAITTRAGSIWTVSLDPATSTLYVADANSGNVYAINTLDNSAENVVITTGAQSVIGLSFNPATSILYAGAYGTGDIYPINTIDDSVGPAIVTTASGILAFALDSAANTLYAGDIWTTRDVYAIPLAPAVAITSGPNLHTAYAGQYETFTATIGNDNNGPYTYNWLVVNSISNAIVGNYLFTSPLSENTLTFRLTSTDASNSPEYVKVIMTDATPNTYNSAYSSTYAVMPAVKITTIPITGASTVSVLSLNGNTLYAGSGSSSIIYLINTHTDLVSAAIPTSEAWGIECLYAADSGTLYAGGRFSNSVYTYNTLNILPTGSIPTIGNRIDACAYDNATDSLYASGTNYITPINTLDNRAGNAITTGLSFNILVADSATNTLYASSSLSSYVYPYNAVSGYEGPYMYLLGKSILSLALNPATDTLYVGNALTGDVYPINTVTEFTTVPAISTGAGSVGAFALDPATNTLYVGDGSSGTIYFINTTDNSTGFISTNAGRIGALAFNSTTNTLYAGDGASGNVFAILLIPLSAGTLSSSAGSTMDVGQTTTLSTSGASGGTGTYSYAWTNLPDGCASSDSNSISCTPADAIGSPFDVTLTVTDSNGGTASADTVLNVYLSVISTNAIGIGTLYLNGNTLYAGDDSTGNVYAINTLDNAFNSVMTTGAGSVFSLAFDSASGTLYIGDADSGNIYSVNAFHNSPGNTINIPGFGSVNALAYDPATSTLYVGSGTSGDIYPISTIDNSIGNAIDTGASGISALALDPAINVLLAADGSSGNIYPINTNDNQAWPAISTGAGAIWAIAFDPSTGILYAGDGTSGNIYPISTLDGSVGPAIATGAPQIFGLAFDPAYSILYAIDMSDGKIYSVGLADNILGPVLTTGAGAVNAVLFDSATSTLYAGDGTTGNVYAISVPSPPSPRVIPAGVRYYLPATPEDSGATMGTGTQELFHFNANASRPVEAPNMQNFVAFNGVDGTPYDCWLEGNETNLQNADNLSASTDLGIWCRIPEGSWFTDNNIYFGFYSPSTNNFNSMGPWGEAPQLSRTYGQYDNGRLVFPFLYQGFKDTGDAEAQGWEAPSTGVSISNGLALTSSSNVLSEELTTSDYGLNSSQVLDSYAYMLPVPDNSLDSEIGYLSAASRTNEVGWNSSYDSVEFGPSLWYNYFYVTPFSCTSGACQYQQQYFSFYGSLEGGGWNIYTTGWSSDSLAEFSYNYGGANSLIGLPSMQLPIGASLDFAGAPNTINVDWMRIRTSPPNGQLPPVTYGPIRPSFVAITSSPLPPEAYVGSYESFTATAYGGTGPFTYNWLVVNSITNAIVGNYLLTSPTSISTLIFQPTSAYLSNSPVKVNVTVTDAVPNTYHSAYSSNYVILPAIPITAIPTNAVGIDVFSPNENILYAGDKNSGDIYSIDTNTETVTEIPTLTPQVQWMFYDPVHGIVYTAGGGSSGFYTYNTLNDSAGNTIDLGSGIGSAAYDNVTNTIWAAAGSYPGGQFIPIDTLTQSTTGTPIPDNAWGITAMAVAGNTIYATTILSGSVSTYNMLNDSGGPSLNTGFGEGGSLYVAGGTLYVGDQGSGDVAAINTTTGAEGNVIITRGGSIAAFAYDYATNTLYLGDGSSGNIYTVNATTDKVVSAIPTSAGSIGALYVDPTTSTLYAGDGSSGNVYEIPLTPPSVSITSEPNSPTEDVDAYANFTATVDNGYGPFTYNWLVVNSNTHAIVGNYLFASPIPANTFTFRPKTPDISNSPEYVNVTVTDAAPDTYNSVYSRSYVIKPGIQITAQPSAPVTIDAGQPLLVNSVATGGAGAFSYSYTSSDCGGVSGSTNSIIFAPSAPTPSVVPQYVADFNGVSSAILTGTYNAPTGNTPISFFAWVYAANDPTQQLNNPALIYAYGNVGATYESGALAMLPTGRSEYVVYTDWDPNLYGLQQITEGTWQQVGFVYDGNTLLTTYVDGNPATNVNGDPSNNMMSAPQDISYIPSGVSLLGGIPGVAVLAGNMSNAQLYDTALTPSQVARLYAEGMEGSPVDMANIISWWPLDGDANDLSGNGNDGIIALNVIYVSPPSRCTITFTANDLSASNTASTAPITILPALSAGTLSSSAGSTMSVGQTTTLSTSGASGGTGTYSYAWTNLPDGCASSDSNSISCTPAGTTGSPFYVTLTVTDGTGAAASANTAVTVHPLVIPTNALEIGALSLVGNTLYVGGVFTGNVYTINTLDNLLAGSPILTGAGGILAFAFDSASNTLYVGDHASSNVIPINTLDNRAGNAITTGAGGVWALAFDNTTSTLYVGYGLSGNVYTINTLDNLPGGNSIHTTASGIRALSLDSATNTLYAGDVRYSGNVIPINTLNNRAGNAITTGSNGIWAIAFDPSTSILYVSDYSSGNVFTINTIDNLPGNEIITTGAPNIISFAFDSATGILYASDLAAGSDIYPISTTDGSVGPAIPTTASGILALALDPATSTLYAGDASSNSVFAISVPSLPSPSVIPTGVFFYLPATPTETGATMGANTQVLFNFDADAYQSVEAPNMQNFIAFNGISGTPYDCWLEGNETDLQNANGLYTSNALGIWCRIPEGSWFTDNNIFFGFYSLSTNNFNGIGPWGEAPQLSSTYGQYDNGKLVFPFLYQDFKDAGDAEAQGWEAPSTGVSISNGLALASASGAISELTTANYGLNSSQVLDGYAYMLPMDLVSEFGNPGLYSEIGYLSAASYTEVGWESEYAVAYGYDAFYITPFSCISGTCQFQGQSYSPPMEGVGWNIYTTGWSSDSLAKFSYNYGSPYSIDSLPSMQLPIGASLDAGSGGTNTINVDWMRMRTSPPNGQMPYATYDPIATTLAPIQVTAHPSTAVSMDVGQHIPVNALATGGTGAFTYSYTSSGCGGLSGSANSLTFTPSTAESCTFTFTANDIYSSNSASTATITVYPIIQVTAKPSTAVAMDVGQSVPVNAVATGGTGAFTYNYIASGCSGYSAAATNSLTFTPTGVGSCTFTFTANDIHTSNSATTAIITVNSNPIMLITANPSSTVTIDAGQPITVSALATLGSGSFAYSYTSTGTACAGFASGSGNTVIFTPTVLGSCFFTFTANDLHTSNTNTISTANIVVVSQPTITIVPSSSSINIGQSISYTANIPSGLGIGPFTVNLVYNGIEVATNSIPAGGGSNTLTYTPVDIGTALAFNAVVTDIGTGYVFNSVPSTITVTPILSNSIANVIVSVSSGSSTTLDYVPAGTTLTITSSNSILANVLISNVTGNYISTLNPGTILVALDFNAVSNTPSSISYTMTVNVPCGTNTEPYKLEGGTWTWLSYNYVAACTISFTVPPDPTVALFTLPSGSGGGSSGGGGPSSGGGGGGLSGPSVTQFGSCYRIANFTNPNNERITLNGTTFSITASAVLSGSAALIINNGTYLLTPNAPVSIGSNSRYNFTATLTGISYLPILHTMTMDVCSVPVHAVAHANVTSSSTIPTTTTTISSTIHATTSVVSTIPANAVHYPSGYSASTLALAGGIIVAVAVIAGAIYHFIVRKRGRYGGNKRAAH